MPNKGLVDAGLTSIQVTSFVHPKWVPQMADAEEVCAQLPPKGNPKREGLTLRGVALKLPRVPVAVGGHNFGLCNEPPGVGADGEELLAELGRNRVTASTRGDNLMLWYN